MICEEPDVELLLLEILYIKTLLERYPTAIQTQIKGKDYSSILKVSKQFHPMETTLF